MAEPVWARVTAEPLELDTLVARVGAPGVGAIASFLGTVRDHHDGRAVTGIDYEAYEPMASLELARVASEAAARWDGVRVAVEHRIGTLAVEEASVAIAVGSARRAPALDAMRHVIETLKVRVPIWKREHYVDGTRAWVDPTRTGPAGDAVRPAADAPSEAAASAEAVS